jgi:hypothetical protein
MYGFIGMDADYLLHELRIIDRFADLKAVLFPNSPLHSIVLAINACTVLFPDENVATDSCLSISRPSTWMDTLSTKDEFKEIENIVFTLQATSVCKYQ